MSKVLRRRAEPIEQSIERLTVHVPIAGCQIWVGDTVVHGGYGAIGFEGRKWRVHRLTWTLKNGPIPKGMYVCHRCDTPFCVNPHHLFLGSAKENTMDMYSKGRQKCPGPKNPLRGEKGSNSKLTEDQVLKIRQLAESGESSPSIADQFGINRTNVIAIVKRKSWTHI